MKQIPEDRTYIEHIQNRYISHRNDMLKRHSKVYQVRFDLRYPQEIQSDLPKDHLSKFTNRLHQDIKRNYKLPSEGRIRSEGKKKSGHDPDPRIILVREKHDHSDHHHVHGIVLLNGHATHSSWDLHKRVERNWANALGESYRQGLVHYCNQYGPAGIMMHRDSQGQIQSATKQAEYLAKAYGKDKRHKGDWLVTGTRLPRDSK